MGFNDIRRKLSKEIENNPRICSHCGKIESIDDLFLKYSVNNEIVILCDDCLLELPF